MDKDETTERLRWEPLADLEKRARNGLSVREIACLILGIEPEAATPAGSTATPERVIAF